MFNFQISKSQNPSVAGDCQVPFDATWQFCAHVDLPLLQSVQWPCADIFKQFGQLVSPSVACDSALNLERASSEDLRSVYIITILILY